MIAIIRLNKMLSMGEMVAITHNDKLSGETEIKYEKKCN